MQDPDTTFPSLIGSQETPSHHKGLYLSHDLPGPPGERLTRTFSMPRHLIERLDGFARTTKQQTGMHIDRSKLLAIGAEIICDAATHIDFSNVSSVESLRGTIYAALVKNGHI